MALCSVAGRWRGRLIIIRSRRENDTIRGRRALHPLPDQRVGLHAGFIEESDGEIGGTAAHIANRLMSPARPGAVLVSRTLKELVVGSSFQFEDRGEHLLKGAPDEWRLFAVQSG